METMGVNRLTGGVSSCNSLGWPVGWPHW